MTVPTDVMLARVGRVRHRRRTRMVAALAGVAVVIATAALVGPVVLRDHIPAGTATPVYSNEVLRAIFAGQHGYVVQRRCTTTRTTETCTAQLLVTTDNGETWHPRYLPTDPGIAGPYRDPSGRSLNVWLEDHDLAVAGPDRRFWTSLDHAITWSESEFHRQEEPDGTVGVVDWREQAVFLIPPDGGFPPAEEGANQVAAARDNSFWVACSGEPCVMFTRDYGRSWVRMPVTTGGAPVDWVATDDGATVYAFAGTAILRSADRGITWSEVGRRRAGNARSVAGVVTADGSLVFTEGRGGTSFRLTAGATHLESLPDIAPGTTRLYRSGSWLVASPGPERREDSPPLGSIVTVSPDNGDTWQTLAPPPA